MNFVFFWFCLLIFLVILSIFFFVLLDCSHKKKLYVITYETYCVSTIIISAKDEHQALKKFKKEVGKTTYLSPKIISFKEV